MSTEEAATRAARWISSALLTEVAPIRGFFQVGRTVVTEKLHSRMNQGMLGRPDQLGYEGYVPVATLVGIYGVGVVVDGDDVLPCLLVDTRLTDGDLEFKRQGHLADMHEVQRVVEELLTAPVPENVRLIAVPPPIAFAGPADAVRCGGTPGTLGALVKDKHGGRAILTAGHVASFVGASAYCGRVLLGSVRYCEQPGIQSGQTPKADVGVIVIDQMQLPYARSVLAGSVISIAGSTAVTASDEVSSYTALGVQHSGILGRFNWVFDSTSGGLWGDTYMTRLPISQPGDSGAPVLLRNTDRIAGHIVGGSAGVASYVQAIDYQLTACQWDLA